MIPDISIKLKPSVLDGVLFLLDQPAFKKPGQLQPQYRAMVSILIPLSRKLQTKRHEWSKRDNASKKYKLKFTYHEAYALFFYIHAMREDMDYGQERNACNMVHDDLRQELQ